MKLNLGVVGTALIAVAGLVIGPVSPAHSANAKEMSKSTAAVTAMVSAANSSNTRVITADQLCKSGLNGLVKVSGKKVTVNLAKNGRSGLRIKKAPTKAKRTCVRALASLTFTNRGGAVTTLRIGEEAFEDSQLTKVVFPAGLTTLRIGEEGFSQSAENGRSTKLKAISFPKNLKTLIIGKEAFEQEVEDGGNNALKSVTFPNGLKKLTIGKEAFAQSSEDGGRNALKKVRFPKGLSTLVVGQWAFAQEAEDSPYRNSLATVSLPGSMKSVTIKKGAFGRYRGDDGMKRSRFDTKQAKLIWRTSKPPATGKNKLILNSQITGNRTTWYWYGKSNSRVTSAWKTQLKNPSSLGSNSGSYVLKQTTVSPSVQTNPKSTTAIRGTKVKFTVKVFGVPKPKITWQYRISSNAKWKAVKTSVGKVSSSGRTLTVTAKKANNGYQFRAKVKNKVGTTNSKAAKLTTKTK